MPGKGAVAESEMVAMGAPVAENAVFSGNDNKVMPMQGQN
jgi:hypothetical protein